MQADRQLILHAVGKVFPLQHAGYGHLRHESNNILESHLAEPFAVVHYPGFLTVKDPENLFLIGTAVLQHLLVGKLRPSLVPPGGIAHHGCIVTDDQDRLMSQILKLLQLQHGD